MCIFWFLKALDLQDILNNETQLNQNGDALK
jgi:hypothetical protein